MMTHEELKARALSDPAVRAEYERIEREEMPMLDAILKARKEAGLPERAKIPTLLGTMLAMVVLAFCLALPHSAQARSTLGAVEVVRSFYMYYIPIWTKPVLPGESHPRAKREDLLRYVTVALTDKYLEDLDKDAESEDTKLWHDYFLKAQDYGDDWTETITVKVLVKDKDGYWLKVAMGSSDKQTSMRNVVFVSVKLTDQGWRISSVLDPNHDDFF
jgi:hypothetical protein